MTMLKSLLGLTVVGLFACAACTGGVSLGQANGPLGAGSGDQDGGGADGSAGSATGPYDITCTFYHRPTATAEFEEQTFTARSDGTAQKTITFSNYAFDVDFGPATDAATDALLSVKSRDRDVVQQYRLAKNTRPVGQFSGDHGFTGLVYLAQEMQYLCQAPGAARPAEQSAPTPIDVACQVELRTTPGGAIEKSAVLELKAGGTQSFTEGEYSVTATMFDDAFEGRGMFVDAKKGSGEYATHQLLQLDRQATIANQLAGTTFTGRFALGTGTNKELSYACSSRGVTGAVRPECGAYARCPTGETCATIPTDSKPRCYKGNPCEVVTCAAGTTCGLAESAPAQALCGK